MGSVVAVLNSLASVCLISFFLFVWLKTDFLISYLKLFNFDSSEYDDISVDNPDLSFLEYLCVKNIDNKFKFFLFKLLSCELCLCFWLSLSVSLFYSVHYVGLFYISSLLLFRLMEKTLLSND